jgi:hypothetical protein
MLRMRWPILRNFVWSDQRFQRAFAPVHIANGICGVRNPRIGFYGIGVIFRNQSNFCHHIVDCFRTNILGLYFICSINHGLEQDLQSCSLSTSVVIVNCPPAPSLKFVCWI